jgi:two-component system NtrC family response regulator
LAKVLLDRYAAESAKSIKGFTEKAENAIRSYLWPGNVRELENRIKRAVIMADGQRISPEDLELDGQNGQSKTLTLREERERLERDVIERALRKHDGNLTQVAADLGVSRPTLYDLMEKLGISR